MSFFMRHYQPWVGRLFEGDYRRLDQKGYNALRYHLKCGGEIPEDFELPSRRDRNRKWAEEVETTGVLVPPTGKAEVSYRDLERLAASMRRKIDRSKS